MAGYTNNTEDSVVHAVNKAAVRNDNGRVLLRQCHPKISFEKKQSQHVIAANNITVGDILNKRKQRQDILKIVMGL